MSVRFLEQVKWIVWAKIVMDTTAVLAVARTAVALLQRAQRVLDVQPTLTVVARF